MANDCAAFRCQGQPPGSSACGLGSARGIRELDCYRAQEDSDEQEKVFHDEVPVGAKIPGETRAERAHMAATMAPDRLLSENPTNYRRWWNNSWFEVEEGGQTRTGEWTAEDDRRLRSLVDHAHRLGFWIRFYTLDGYAEKDNRGWDEGYRFSVFTYRLVCQLEYAEFASRIGSGRPMPCCTAAERA